MAPKVTRKFELIFWDVAIPVLSSARDVRNQIARNQRASDPSRTLIWLNQGLILILAAICGFALGVFFYLMVS